MRALVVAILGAALMAPLPSAAKDDPVTLAKTTKWEMNYDADSCHLLAKFGRGEDTLLLRMTRYEPGDALTLMLYARCSMTSASGCQSNSVLVIDPCDKAKLGQAQLPASNRLSF